MSYKRAKELMADVLAVFKGEGVAECLRRGEEVAAKWEKQSPQVAKMMRDGGLGDCLTVLGFPADHRRRLASTNLLENLMKRLKKRTRAWWACSPTAPAATG